MATSGNKNLDDNNNETKMFCRLTLHTLPLTFSLDLAGVTCPSGFYANGLHGTCLTAITRTVTWQDARRQCAQVGGQLVRSDSDAMVDFLTQVIKDNGISVRKFWIDVNDLWEDGEFRRLDGANVTYFRWQNCCDSGVQPNGGSDQGCVIQFVRDLSSDPPPNSWEDKHCISFTGSALCEVWPQTQATIDSKVFEVVAAPPETETHLEILVTMDTVSKAECATACKADNLCDGFATRATLPTDDNCILLTLQEVTMDESRAIAATLAGYTLYRIAY
ncbi:hypothetical protein BaRGS_00011323 [Batillaria attramentaria]|uniref:C-type lectin domain-containing protein n=1 Tax=Batillaria attramentaria TaxID=370345 RepID=A0ABD0LDR4_9CAEN